MSIDEIQEEIEILTTKMKEDQFMKDCAFQYATGDGNIVKNTDLISREEAEQLWQDHIELFKSDVESGKCPEMVIWVEMETNCSYHKTVAHWHGDDFVVRNGKMYSINPVA